MNFERLSLCLLILYVLYGPANNTAVWGAGRALGQQPRYPEASKSKKALPGGESLSWRARRDLNPRSSA
jgi:hypothetical protein